MEMEILRKKFMTLLNKSFEEHLEFFKNKILNKENFVFARYADGERMILNNSPILEGTQAYNIDNWKYNNNLIFSKDLYDTCTHKEHNYYYAISCKCCDPTGQKFYSDLLRSHNLTFSNLFINANYDNFINFVNNLKQNVVLIANKNCLNSKYPFNVIKKIPIENDCVNWYEENKDTILKGLKLLSNNYNDTLFFISAGPLSEIIIHNLYLNNPNNMYVDVGSSLDVYTHKKNTRPYQDKNSQYSKKVCIL
jgi:hypothetical protein